MINLDFEALRSIGLTPSIATQIHLLASDFDSETFVHAVRVSGVHRDQLTLHNGQTLFKLSLSQTQIHDESFEQPVVGDWGLVSGSPETNHTWLARVERTNQLTRINSEGHRQDLVANVDTALLVMGLDKNFNLRRLERYLALSHAAQISPIIVLTKADVHNDAEQRVNEVKQRVSADIPVFAVNTRCDNTTSLLEPWLGAGQTLVLLGSSGAGKSSLTNTLTKSAQATGSVRLSDSRGHHTTTSRSLHLSSSGACIIDTPGLRGLRLDLDEGALAASFSDIDTLAQQCQFRNCQHGSEPGCAVRELVDDDRLRNYQKLMRETCRHLQTPLEKIAARAKWKVLIKSVKRRNRTKQSSP